MNGIVVVVSTNAFLCGIVVVGDTLGAFGYAGPVALLRFLAVAAGLACVVGAVVVDNFGYVGGGCVVLLRVGVLPLWDLPLKGWYFGLIHKG